LLPILLPVLRRPKPVFLVWHINTSPGPHFGLEYEPLRADCVDFVPDAQPTSNKENKAAAAARCRE
jgi:hypothetical protein